MRQRACGIVIRDEHLLMVRHVHDNRDYWTFPGGGIEAGETILQAARREVQEETGIELNPLGLIYSFESNDNQSHCVLMASPPTLIQPVLGHDPEEADMPPSERMLKAVAWRRIAEVDHHPIIENVIKAARI